MARIQVGDPIDIQTMSKASAPIGEIKQSMLDIAAFNDENLGTWFLCDGQNSVIGTTYGTASAETLTPDMRGRVPRMKDHGASQDADGERALGHNQGQATAKNGLTASSSTDTHNHLHGYSIQDDYAHVTQYGYGGDTAANGFGFTRWENPTIQPRTSSDSHNHSITINQGDNETRMKNTCVNFYIKVEY